MSDDFKYHTSCEACGSSDNNAVYESGNTYCFGCEKFVRNNQNIGDRVDEISQDRPDVSKLKYGYYGPLRSRGISEATCRKYGYQISDEIFKDEATHIAPYHNAEGQLTAQNLRGESTKTFKSVGSTTKTMQTFGQSRFADGGKQLVICEGEIDALSVYEATGSKGNWTTSVGVPGVSRAPKFIKANLEWIESFEKVIIFFDADEVGIQAAKKATKLISYGKAEYVTDWPNGCKDANDILVKLGKGALASQLYKTTQYVPDGIKAVKELRYTPSSFNVSLYPWKAWNKKLFARRSGEITMYAAGSGQGKSTIMRAIYGELAKAGESCAMIMLEESVEETKADLMSNLTGKPIRRLMAQLAVNQQMIKQGMPMMFPDVEPIADQVLEEAEQAVNDSGLILVDHMGGYTLNSILSQVRFLAVSKGVKHILIDHITLLVASDDEHDDPNKAADALMKNLSMLCEETGVAIDVISHIRKGNNGAKSANNGGQLTMEAFRGSNSLTQIADNVIVFERDQQSEDSNITKCRSLKTRLSGFTGVICELRYDAETGQLLEHPEEYNDDGDTETSYG